LFEFCSLSGKDSVDPLCNPLLMLFQLYRFCRFYCPCCFCCSVMLSSIPAASSCVVSFNNTIYFLLLCHFCFNHLFSLFLSFLLPFSFSSSLLFLKAFALFLIHPHSCFCHSHTRSCSCSCSCSCFHFCSYSPLYPCFCRFGYFCRSCCSH